MDSLNLLPAYATWENFKLWCYNKQTQFTQDLNTGENLHLDTQFTMSYNAHMLTKITPEGFDIANAYIQFGTVEEVANQLSIPQHEVAAVLKRKEVKDYLDGVYLDMGYRNRNKLGQLLDKMIEAKLEEAEESGVLTSVDLFKLVELQHKMRMDELKLLKEAGPANVTQIANFGDGNYGKLMEKLLSKKG